MHSFYRDPARRPMVMSSGAVACLAAPEMPCRKGRRSAASESCRLRRDEDARPHIARNSGLFTFWRRAGAHLRFSRKFWFGWQAEPWPDTPTLTPDMIPTAARQSRQLGPRHPTAPTPDSPDSSPTAPTYFSTATMRVHCQGHPDSCPTVPTVPTDPTPDSARQARHPRQQHRIEGGASAGLDAPT